MITLFTDGSSRGNPGPGGWGAIIIKDDVVNEMGGREDLTTNNRMELTAVISALEALSDEHDMTVITDSAYVLNGATRWVTGWQLNKWKTSQKEDVLNRDLWERLIGAMKHKSIKWTLVKGHSGHSANERCDVIATSFADGKQPVLYRGSLERYGVSIETAGYALVAKTKQKAKRKAYSYVSNVDGVIQIHNTWEECKARVNGVPNAKFKKSISPEDEQIVINELS